MEVKSYKDLVVWQKSMVLVELVYQVTREFPREEIYGLTSQVRRAAVSVPSNIAEGQARYSKAEFRHFLSIARGSLAEVETQLLIARRLGYLSVEQLELVMAVHVEVSKMIPALVRGIVASGQ